MSDVQKLPRNSLWRELVPGEILRDEAGQGYRVIRFIAEGGYSQVYEAEREIDPHLYPHVALKVLNLKHRKNKKTIRRQLSEAKALYQLNHPNVVRVHALGMREDTGTVFMVMDLPVGRTMRDLVRDLGGRMPIPWTLEIMVSVCRGLSAIHTLAVHRDLKPENIHARDDGHISLFDLGTSRFQKEDRVTTQGYTIGTLNYMSPEQLAGDRELDGRSDLFAVGTMLFELLTGQNPFTGAGGRRGRQEIGNEIMFRQHTPMNELRAPSAPGKPGKLIASNVPPHLVEIVERLLRKEPADRYRSAALVADLLSAALAKFTYDNLAYPALPISTLGEVPRTGEPDEGDEPDESDAGASVPTSTNPFLSVSFPPDDANAANDGGPRRPAPSLAYASTEQIATYALPAAAVASARAARVSAEVVDVSDEAEAIDEDPADVEVKPTYRFVGIAKLDRPPVEESGVDAVYMDPDELTNSTLSPHARRSLDSRHQTTERVRLVRPSESRGVPPIFLYMVAVAAIGVAALFVLGSLGILGHRAAAQGSPAVSATAAPAPAPEALPTAPPRAAPEASAAPLSPDAGAPAATARPRRLPPAATARPTSPIEPGSLPKLIF